MIDTNNSFTNKISLNCLQINLQHCKNASLNLSQVLIDLNIDIALIQEPYAITNKFNNEIFIPNIPVDYTVHHNLNVDHAYGAVILAKKYLKAENTAVPNSNSIIGVKLNLYPNLNFISAYCRPSLCLNYNLSFIENITNFKQTIIGMDSNARNKLWNSKFTDKRGVELESFIEKKTLNIANTPCNKLEYIPKKTAMVDLTLMGDNVNISNWHFLLEDSHSDHPLIQFEVAVGKPKNFFETKPVPKLKNIDKIKFIKKIECKIKTIVNELPNITTKHNLDSIIGKLTDIITISAKQSKLPSNKISKSKLDFWSEELLELRSKLRDAKELAFKTNNDVNYKIHSDLKAEYQRLLRKSKSKAFENHCTVELNNDPFKGLKKLAASQGGKDIPGELIINGQSITEKEAIVKELCKSFFPNEKQKGHFQEKTVQDYKSYTREPNQSIPPLITKVELKNSIFSLNSKSAPGTDGIGIDIIQLAYSIISDVLLSIYNLCIKFNYYPKNWKIAKVTILKKPNKTSYKDVKSYRPISVLNTLGKIFEKIIYDRLAWLAEKDKWFGVNQHGFREGKSTETAMHSLANTIETNFKNKILTSVIFLDISGAFDCAWPPAILAALAKYKCPIYLIKIIESLFHNREANITIDDFIFKYIVTIGCPQGGILSPFLWIILAEQLINLSFPFQFKIIGYADDIALVAMHKVLQISIANLQIMCNEIFKNCDNVLLDINPLKSIFMIFCKRCLMEVETQAVSVKIKETQILPSNSTKFVGFEVDSKLNWKNHVESKCLATLRVIRNLKYCLRRTWGLNTQTLKKLYKSIVVPKLLYGVSVWSSCLTKRWCINKLRSTQYHIVKSITRSYKTAHKESLLIISNLLPIDIFAMEFAALRYFAFKNSQFSISSAKAIEHTFSDCDLVNVSATESSRIFRSRNHPPWLASAITYQDSMTAVEIEGLLRKPNTLNILASTTSKEKAITARIIYGSSSANIYDSQEVVLPKFTSATQAEIGALQLAIQYAISKKAQYGTCNIFSISKAALNRVTTFKKISKPAAVSREMLLENTSFISLHGLKSNDLSTLGGSNIQIATSDISLTETKMSPSSLQLIVRKKTNALWKKEWAESTKGAITKKFFPSPTDAFILERTYISHQTTQLLTGHCQLNYYFFKIKKITSPLCDCGHENETIEHYLFSCTRFTTQRKLLKDVWWKNTAVYPPPLSTIATTPAIWKELLQFVKATRRLDHTREVDQ